MKHVSIGLLAIALAALSAEGCGHDAVSVPAGNEAAAGLDLAAMKNFIEGKNSQFTRAHVTGDRATIDGMFAEGARVLPPGGEAVIGRAAIDAMTAEYLEFGITEFREETTDFYGNDDLLVDQGNYVLVYGKNRVIEKGKYLNVWRKVGGEWKIHSNIWNTNAPLLSTE